MSAFMAFVHPMAVFTLVAALAVELVLVRPPIDFERAQAGIVLLILCAALMARGIGMLA